MWSTAEKDSNLNKQEFGKGKNCKGKKIAKVRTVSPKFSQHFCNALSGIPGESQSPSK
jgi:hypothetical protein